jgi:hypothetical protein
MFAVVSTAAPPSETAMRLYRRLGFVIEEDKGVYDLMRWKPRLAAVAQLGSRR